MFVFRCLHPIRSIQSRLIGAVPRSFIYVDFFWGVGVEARTVVSMGKWKKFPEDLTTKNTKGVGAALDRVGRFCFLSTGGRRLNADERR